MNNKQRKTLHNIFEDPIRSDIKWSDIQSLIIALGGQVTTGSGSTVRLLLNGVRAVFHRPHPGDLTKKGVVRDIRSFLFEARIRNDEI